MGQAPPQLPSTSQVEGSMVGHPAMLGVLSSGHVYTIQFLWSQGRSSGKASLTVVVPGRAKSLEARRLAWNPPVTGLGLTLGRHVASPFVGG